MNRKNFITAMSTASVASMNSLAGGRIPGKLNYKISLAQWSIRVFHRAKPGTENYLDPLDFAVYAKKYLRHWRA